MLSLLPLRRCLRFACAAADAAASRRLLIRYFIIDVAAIQIGRLPPYADATLPLMPSFFIER